MKLTLAATAHVLFPIVICLAITWRRLDPGSRGGRLHSNGSLRSMLAASHRVDVYTPRRHTSPQIVHACSGPSASICPVLVDHSPTIVVALTITDVSKTRIG